ncbi:hypothetical protein CAEBREN_28599 [Caenorhabditis brenneri]|uniref:Serine/threonine-protein phosphatase n=1 Tax=Caenorhabditis brenneri TaxID=135651 RepID=G0NM19_CAEBE|nr:hypothetical protein CAEBREN_28599 [Caenorhabditis brenneri]
MRNARSVSKTEPDKSKDILQTFEKLFSYGRFLNGVSLAQSMLNNTNNEKEIVRELLNIRRTVGLNVMQSIPGMPDLVSGLYSKDICAGDGKPCEDLGVIGSGTESLAKVGDVLKTDYGAILADGSVLDNFLKLKNTFNVVDNMKKYVGILITHLEGTDKSKTDEEKDILATDFKSGSRTLFASFQEFKNLLTSMNSQLLTQSKFEEDVGKILRMETIENSFKKESLEQFKSKLTLILKLSKELTPKLSKDNLSKMEKNLNDLFSVVDPTRLSADEKPLTPAFYSGASDFDKLSKDVEDLFPNNASRKKLKQLFSSLANLSEEMKPIRKILQEESENMTGVEGNVMKEFEEAEKEVALIEKTKPLLDCVEKVAGFKVKGDLLEKWKPEKSNAVKIGQYATEFFETCKNATIILSELEKFKNETYDVNILKMFDKIHSSTKKPAVIGELKTAVTKLKELHGIKISEWEKATKIHELIPPSKQWLTSPEISSTLECVQNKTMLDQIQQGFANRAMFSGLKKLKADNQLNVKLGAAAKTLSSATKEYAALLNKRNKRNVPSNETVPILENSQKICVDLSAGLKIYRDLIHAYASKNDIELILKKGADIQALIEKVTNPKQKKKLELLWSAEARKTLSSIPGIVEKINKNITTSPKQIKEFEMVFKTPVNFGDLTNVDMQSLIDNIQSMDSNLVDPELAKRLRPLQMDFAKGNSKIQSGLKAFQESLPWFAKLSPQSSLASDKWDTIVVLWEDNTVLVVFVGAAAAALGFGSIYSVINKRKKKVIVVSTRDTPEPKPGRPPNSNETKIYQKKDGQYYIKPTSNYSETLVTCIDVDFEKNEDKEVRIEEVKDVETRKQLETEVLKADKFGKDQNENELDVSVDKAFCSEKVIRTYTAEDKNLLSEERLETADAIELSEKFSKTREESTKQLEKTQSNVTVDQTQEGGHDDIQGTEERKTGGGETAPLIEKEVGKNESVGEPYPDKHFTDGAPGKTYVVDRIDEVWNPTLKKVLNDRYKSGKFKFDGKLGECYIKKYYKKPFNIRKETRHLLLKFMMKKEIVHYRKTLDDLEEPNKNLSLIPREDYLAIVKEAKDLFAMEADCLELKRTKLRLVGDLHGCHDDMARHMEIGIDDEESTYLFLGDYVDRGEYDLNVILHLCLLKLSNPKRYYFLRGNHEYPQVNASNKKERCFLQACIKTFGEKDGKDAWEKTCDMLLEMPVAAITQGNIWNAHGGLSALMLKGREWLLANLKKKPKNMIQTQLLVDVLWSDPTEKEPMVKDIHTLFPLPVKIRTKYNHEFTREGQERIFKACGFVGMFRGHQVNFGCQAVLDKKGKTELILFRCHDRTTKTKQNVEEDKTGHSTVEEQNEHAAKKDTPKPTNDNKETESKSKSGASTSKDEKKSTDSKKSTSKETKTVTKKASKRTTNSKTPAKKK